MIITTEQLNHEYRFLKDPRHKIFNETQKGKLFPIKRGLYETDKTTPGYLLANSLLGPSYLSFEYALFYYSMIPERVVTYTSATFNKGKILDFQNYFGMYRYRDIPKEVYPYYYTRVIIDNYPLLIATKEKALCDKLSIESPIRGLRDFEEYLFDGLRLDEEEFTTNY
ncbi:MAG: hypothetical protein HUK24_01765, partial [Sphaerochaetaceae bacterium]|nr:hypothetical protein [Sphaerochaetaceae bacterium]